MAGTLENLAFNVPSVEFNLETDPDAAYIFFRDIKEANILTIEATTREILDGDFFR